MLQLRILVPTFLALTLSLSAQSEKSSNNASSGNGEQVTSTPVSSEGKGASDQAWINLATKLAATPTVTEVNKISGSPSSKPSDVAAADLSNADQAKDFYTRFPQHPKAVEARKLEAVLLIDAVGLGDNASSARMESTVQTLRVDSSVPAFDRAVVAGTYEFKQAGKRVKTLADLMQQYEAVARGLIKEFPDQPQGYISLLTQATQHDPATARTMAMEVIKAKAAPSEVSAQAQRLVTRLDLVGQSVDKVFTGFPVDTGGKGGWPQGKAGLIYFWASWSPYSVDLGELLAGKKLSKINVIGVCLNIDAIAAAAVAKSHKLPGQLVYAPKGMAGDLAVRLGADTAPLLYLVDTRGRVTDVLGLNDLEAKLAALGL
jgi:hypothetical protein